MSELLRKERSLLENTAERLLSLAVSQGAEKAEVAASFSQKTKISLEKQDYHMASADDGFQFGLRVLKQGKQGFSSTNTLDSKDLKEVASRAIEIAGFSPPNPHSDIITSDHVPAELTPSLFDPALHSVSLQTQREWTKLMVDEALKDKRFRLNEGSFEVSSSLFLVINSLGTHKVEKETAAGWSLMGMGAEDGKLTSFDYFQEISRRLSGMADRLITSTRSFVGLVLDNLRQVKGKTYKGIAVFSPRAVSEILLSSLEYHFNGRNLAEETTRWKIGRLGESLFPTELTLFDNPWLNDRSGCTLFDREGTPTKKRALIQKGVWSGALLDQYSGHVFGRPSTGNAAGGPQSLPSVGSHSLCLLGGEEALSDLLKRVTSQQPEFLLVHRYSGQVDPISGDFSGVAKGGEWWSGGARVGFVQETLISGNIFDLLSALCGISRETEVVDAGEESPTLAVDGVSVTSSGH